MPRGGAPPPAGGGERGQVLGERAASGRARPRPRSPTTSPASSGGAQDLSPLGGRDAREGEVHPQVGLARRPHRAQRPAQVPAAEAPRASGGSRATASRHHPLGQVEALAGSASASGPACARSSTGSRGRAWPASSSTSPRPSPGRAGARSRRCRGGRRRRSRPRPPRRTRRFFLSHAPQARLRTRVVEHRPAPGREVRRRHEAGGVGPVLEQQRAGGRRSGPAAARS